MKNTNNSLLATIIKNGGELFEDLREGTEIVMELLKKETLDSIHNTHGMTDAEFIAAYGNPIITEPETMKGIDLINKKINVIVRSNCLTVWDNLYRLSLLYRCPVEEFVNVFKYFALDVCDVDALVFGVYGLKLITRDFGLNLYWKAEEDHDKVNER